MSLSLILMVAAIYLLFERKYRWLLPPAFLYVWTYSLWVMLAVAAVIWTVVLLWSERPGNWRLVERRPVVYVAVGVILGFVINPYFPHNVRLFYEHIAMKVTLSGFSTNVGGEWYPWDSWEFLRNLRVACSAMLVGFVTVNLSDRKRS